MKHTILSASLLALSAAFLVSFVPASQAEKPAIEFPQPSPTTTVKSRIGITDVEIVYSRPSAKGRKVFGELVPLGELWRTGANSATKVTFGTDVTIQGNKVPAGAYSLLTIPAAGEWTVILNTVAELSGTTGYDEKKDQLRVKVKSAALANPVESFRISLEDLRDDSASLTIAWEKTSVSIPIQVDVVGMIKPKIEAAMSGEGTKPYYQAAMFYYEHDLDMKQAAKWMEEANKARPDTVWMVYRHGLILAKAGDKAGALDAANRSLALAAKIGGAQGAEYKRLNEQLIASLK